MSLATRCPACGTIFRVVQDQLRVSQGWVRCGRCTEAFNALESMVELPPPRVPAPEVPAPSPGIVLDAAAADGRTTSDVAPAKAPPPPEPQAADMASIDLPPGTTFIASDGAIGGSADVPWPEPASVAPPESGPEPAPAAVAAPALESWPEETPRGATEDAAAGPDAAPRAASVDVDEVRVPAEAAALAAVPASPADPAPSAPSFIVQAERAERWRRPGVRLALGAGVLLSALVLVAQVSHTFRDRLAASAPSLKPVLVQACALLDCRVGDVRQIDALSVETSALVRVEGTSVYRLSVTLRNRAAIDIAAPALDLALTDAQGRPIARRVLQMADLDLPLRVLKAGTELPIQVPLGIGDRQVSGYTVEIFYP